MASNNAEDDWTVQTRAFCTRRAIGDDVTASEFTGYISGHFDGTFDYEYSTETDVVEAEDDAGMGYAGIDVIVTVHGAAEDDRDDIHEWARNAARSAALEFGDHD